MDEIKGHCEDCNWKRQEWVTEYEPDGQEQLVLDTFCHIFDVFVPGHGYCWCWEAVSMKAPVVRADIRQFCADLDD